MTLSETIERWGYEPIPGESEDCGTVEVFGTDRFTVTYSIIEGMGEVEVLDRSTNPHDLAAAFHGQGVTGIRQGIESAFAFIGSAS